MFIIVFIHFNFVLLFNLKPYLVGLGFVHNKWIIV